MTDRYVLLTGGKNNAGDFLIKHRLKRLLQELRPERALVDFDAWKPLSPEQLQIINDSKALILAGGPSLQKRMRSTIYPLVEDLNQITVPIIMMGVGWKSPDGSWEATHRYSLNEATQALLKRIDGSGYLSSVRDYHTLNALFHHGVTNVLMTGCPALFSLEHLNREPSFSEPIRRVSFSLGVSFVDNPAVERYVQQVIRRVREAFVGTDLTVVFHHSLDATTFGLAYRGKEHFLERHLEFARWLQSERIAYVDVSGGEQHLIEHYSQSDLHIGYRVHAHIFMSSISKPSILINEDGRGTALRDVLGGLSFDAYRYVPEPTSVLDKVMRRLANRRAGAVPLGNGLAYDVVTHAQYELRNGFPRLRQVRHHIDRHFTVMKRFVEQLP